MTIVFRVIRFTLRWTRRLVFFAIVALFVQASTIPVGTQDAAITMLMSPFAFDYIGWEINAIGVKIGQTLWGEHPFMDESTRSQTVRDYFEDLKLAQALDGEIAAMYADPNSADPEAASAEQRSRRDSLRADLESRQALVEAILEGQVAAVLIEEGFGVMGQLIPPISMHFTRIPNLLVVSPRDELRVDFTMTLLPLSVDEEARIENELDEAFDISTLIVPLGGMALYPAMIVETSDLRWAVETFAHEWSHHYLLPTPLGLNYDISPEARSINETTADVFGKEIGRKVLARYYPEMVAQSPPPNPSPNTGRGVNVTFIQDQRVSSLMMKQGLVKSLPHVWGRDLGMGMQQPSFDFGAEMHETRVTVDELLAQGKVDEAEEYMEARRQYFYENGYGIRKLNQAYFAFYGGYQAGIPGIAGQDPIGPAIREIRDLSPSVRDFMLTMQGIISREQLVKVRDAMQNKKTG